MQMENEMLTRRVTRDRCLEREQGVLRRKCAGPEGFCIVQCQRADGRLVAGHRKAMRHLARLTFVGEAVEKDADRGMKLLLKASELGDVESASLLGKLLMVCPCLISFPFETCVDHIHVRRLACTCFWCRLACTCM